MKRKAKKIVGLAIAVALLSVNTGCLNMKRIKASDNYVTKEIKAEGFNAITLQGGENVIFQQSTDSTSSVKVYGADNVVDLMDIRVENGTLIISKKDQVMIFGSKSEVKVMVSAPTLNKITVQGSGDVVLKKSLRTDKLEITIEGSGDIKADSIYCNELSSTIQGSGDIELKGIKGETVEAMIQGSGDILLTGEAKTVSLETQGSGEINAGGLKGENVKAATLGAGNISCHATSYLKGEITGSGDISYKGSPKIDFPQGKNFHKEN